MINQRIIIRLRVAAHMLATVMTATVIALFLENWLLSTTLVLVYVLAVIFIGIKHGSIAAIFGAIFSFLTFNYFFTVPRYTFDVTHDEDVATLIFLFLIALACGPAAARIRNQFNALKIANQYSETLRKLGESLSVCDYPDAVWTIAVAQLSPIIGADCCILTFTQNGTSRDHFITEAARRPENIPAVKQKCITISKEFPFEYVENSSRWRIFTLKDDSRFIVSIAKIETATPPVDEHLTRLVMEILKQSLDAWHRLSLSAELDSTRLDAEINELRSALLSSVSHDLRSPLAAMMGSAESLSLLDQQLSTDDRRELLDTILSESRRLDNYIQNLLDMTRLGHGGLKIARDWVSIDDVIGSAVSRLRRYHPEIEIEYRRKHEPPLLFIHAALIEQALFNVLENAQKFSPSGEAIRIITAIDGDNYTIVTEDEGPGIPPPEHEKVFDMFYSSTRGDQKPKSTGMGLAICQGMVSAHGGRVEIENLRENNGTRIIISLPIEHATHIARQTTAEDE